MRKQLAHDQRQQHLNMEMIGNTTDHNDDSDKEYCGYDVGTDFHQGNEDLNKNFKKINKKINK